MDRYREIVAHLFHPRRSNNHRSKLLHPEYLLLLAVVTVCVMVATITLERVKTPWGVILGYASDINVAQVIEQTNTQRARSGLAALSYSETLSSAARAKAADMFAQQYWAHTSPTGKEPWDFMKAQNYTYRIAGENLARDFMDTGSMVQAWMASPTHRANIMNNRYKEIGVAVVNGTLQGVETTLVVQMFGDPVVVVAPAQISEESVALELPAPIPEETVATNEVEVLSSVIVPSGELTQNKLVAPIHIWKAVALAIAFLVIGTLLYDGIVAHHTKVNRIVGKNIAHIAFFTVLLFIVIFFKGGMIE